MFKSRKDDEESYQGVAREVLEELSLRLNFRYFLLHLSDQKCKSLRGVNDRVSELMRESID